MRSLCLSDRPTLEQLLEVQEHFGLPGPALVEKDWYVIKALAAVAAVDTGGFRLVFGGGTALSRAYRLTRRMSEDVDLKIVREKAPSRGELSKLRTDITDALLAAGFSFDPENHRKAMYKGHYTKYQLPYEPIAAGKGILRPDVQIETSVWPLRREAAEKPVISFIAEAYGQEPEVPKIACSSVLETAAEKLVGLTWRAGSELAGLRDVRDPTLVRHIYDLHVIREHYDPAEAAALALDVMKADAATRGDRFPAWQKDPLGETLRAIEGIPKDKVFIDGYANFLRDIVYGDGPNFNTAMASLKTLGDHLRKHQV
jgi:predicted nucleotidyltransferase component of viral defense system